MSQRETAMRNDYVEAKPGLLSNINIVPLVGVFAALLVVVMLGFPSLTARHNQKNIGIYCGPASKEHTHFLKIHVDSSGNATIDNVAATNDEISEIISSAPQVENHRIVADVDIDPEASYQDAMSLIAALHRSGLEEKNIRILDSRWR